jgi:Flp pilus assembly protein TadD
MWLAGIVLEQQQRPEEAEARYRQALEIHPEDTRALPALGHLLARTGRRGEAEAIRAVLKRQQESGRPIEYWLALIELGFGNKEAALGLLEQACERHDQSTPYIGVDPRLEVLRDEPRFVALKQRLRLG